MKRFFVTVLIAVFAAGTPFALAGGVKNHEKGSEPLKVAHGAEIDLAEYLVAGKTTVFDFTSQYCPPCQAIAPFLDRIHLKRDDIAVVKVDINRPDVRGIDWKSPVARQYELRSIPHFKVYSPEGKLIAEGDEARALVLGWIDAVEKSG